MCIKTNVFKVFSKTLLFFSLILIGFSSTAQTKLFDVEFKDCKVYIKQTTSKEIWSIKPVNGFWYDGNPTTPTYNFASGNTSRSIMYNQFNSVKFEGVVYTVTSAPTLADTIKNYLKFCKDLSSVGTPDTSANAILRAIKDSIAQTNTAIRLQDSSTQSRKLVTITNDSSTLSRSLINIGNFPASLDSNTQSRKLVTFTQDSTILSRKGVVLLENPTITNDSTTLSRKLITFTQDSTTLSRKLVTIEPLNETIEHIQLTASGTDNNAVNTLRGIGITGSFDATYDVIINGNSISYDVSQGLLFADYNVENGTINDTIDITCTAGTIIISKLK